MARLKLFLPLLFVIGLGAVFWKVLNTEGYDPQELPSALVEKKFPAFSLPSLLEPQKTLNALSIVGEPMLVNVWASWCPTCYYEHPYLMELASRGVKIVGINYKDEAEKGIKVLNDMGNPFSTVVFDKDGFLGLELGVTGAPETFIVDADGVVKMRFQGALDQAVWDKKFSALWQQLGGVSLNEKETTVGAGNE